ncbi:hypothetical protein [uncultured Tenacibaculum sp.]|uniref:hypothetical protein n=1 Tax=uncultured Tenacibaculum sp. TaxID=174713 RepID=UPI0026204726|nr:hypothetical protein [uncultured Tenacibaculum sp.]
MSVILFIYLFITGCYTSKKTVSDTTSSSYEIKKFKSSDNWITINAYDNEISYGKLIPIIKINKLYFFDDGIETFNVEGSKHNIRISHIGKIPITIKDLVVKKGDSIVINAYLKDDPTPIVD